MREGQLTQTQTTGSYILFDISEDLERDECDSTDCVFEEYTSPRPTNDRFAWKQARPSACMSLVQSIITVSTLSLAGGAGSWSFRVVSIGFSN